jgi:uncharacterized protein
MKRPSGPMLDLSLRQARRIALTAIGLAKARPANPTSSMFLRMADRLSLLQIDSVSVLARAHYLPGYSRLGAYDRSWLDKAAQGKKRRLFEYWGHEASLIAIEHQPDLRWRMARARAGHGIYQGLARFGREKAAFIETVLREVEAAGPISARDLSESDRGQGGWWGWSDGKKALEWLFWAGLVTTHSRRGFERVYDITERVLPRVAALPTPAEDDAMKRLLLAAARSLGVATLGDLRAYWRIGPQDASRHVAELVEDGHLQPASVEGWRQPAFVLRDRPPNSRPAAAALVSPFDPLLWERDRAERLLDFHYRIEIYTPAHKRQHGYYVIPFLWKDRIVARLDLKADKASGALLVHSAHREGPAQSGDVVAGLAQELRRLALWLDLSEIRATPMGDLGQVLRAELGRAG